VNLARVIQHSCWLIASIFRNYPPYPRFASANSSGAAAHPVRDDAVTRAVLELVERDSFMIVWLNRLVMPTINPSSLPDEFAQRVRLLEEAGFMVHVKDFSLDLAPVMLVFVQHMGLHYTTCSACAAFDPAEALDHALMEVEAAVYSRLTFGLGAHIGPEDVITTRDHGRLYEQEGFFWRADFFTVTRCQRAFDELDEGVSRTWDGLLKRFREQDRRTYVVDLPCPEIRGVTPNLRVVKCFVTGLVPISFGYLEEPCGMSRIYEVPLALGLGPVLSYDDLNRFPHPYT
jgi:ribosomal protein S12 methylthiotransferase accessory factor